MRITFFVISLVFLAGCKPGEVPVSIQKEIDSIAAVSVPDAREGILSYTLKLIPKDEILVKGETNQPEAKIAIINYLSKTGLKYCDSIALIPDRTVIKNAWGLVTVSVCNMKKHPSHSSELVSQAIMGTPVKILKNDGGWLLIQTPDYYLGWVDDSGITELSDEEIEAWRKSARIIYTFKSGDILSENGESVISDIVAGSVVQSIVETKDYYIVLLPDGRHGRIEKNEAQNFRQWCFEINPRADKMTLFAKSFLGSPYMWGGTSTKAPDCSGFAKTIYFTAGVILSRDASLQFLHGSPVEISAGYENFEPGDLLFFGYMRDGKKRITHVGMYIGDSEIIHSSGMVKINSLDSTRSNFSKGLVNSMLGARRIIGSDFKRGVESVAGNSWYNNVK